MTYTTYRFGRFELRPSQRSLQIDGKAVSLGARAFDVLTALIERRERVVASSELIELVWPTVVVEENNLRQQVAALRHWAAKTSICRIFLRPPSKAPLRTAEFYR